MLEACCAGPPLTAAALLQDRLQRLARKHNYDVTLHWFLIDRSWPLTEASVARKSPLTARFSAPLRALLYLDRILLQIGTLVQP
jgi:hypothetical protein